MPYRSSSGAFKDYEPLTEEQKAGMSESEIKNYEERAREGGADADLLQQGAVRPAGLEHALHPLVEIAQGGIAEKDALLGPLLVVLPGGPLHQHVQPAGGAYQPDELPELHPGGADGRLIAPDDRKERRPIWIGEAISSINSSPWAP